MLTSNADTAEPKRYELSLLNCDVSGTYIAVPLQEKTHENISVQSSSKHSHLPDLKFKNSQILYCGLKISNNLCQKIIEAEPLS
jgi:hypothetical protein